MNEFCPKCGSTKGPFLASFCYSCYLEDHELITVPDSFDIERCVKCGRTRLSGKWVAENNAFIAEFLEKKTKLKEMDDADISVEFEESPKGEQVAKITARGEVAGKNVTVSKTVLINFKRVACPSCGKISGGYFEAKIQIRWDSPRDLKKEKSICAEIARHLAVMRETNPMALITEEGEAPNGRDIYIGSNKAARTTLSVIKSKFGAKVQSSAMLAGIDEHGKERYRITYSMRL
ncbi:MAG: NMD3-related protein [Candidatus Diapherotrites archaeon]